jgi:predicted NBD/HSP70 family sugar kinase
VINFKGFNIASVHQDNRAKILQIFFLHAPISRIEIAKLTSLTPPTITSSVNTLMEAGLVKECEEATSKNEAALGRKPILLDIVKEAGYAIGVDWGPNGIICSITDLRGNVLDIARTVNKRWDIEPTISETTAMIKQLIKRNNLNQEKIVGIGVGIPGFVEIETGVVRYSPAHGWKNVSVGKALEDQTGLPVCVENNVRVMAVGEMLFSEWRVRASGITGNFLYVFVGNGIACAIVHNNELLRGNVFGAGELGHTIVSWDGPECRCGKRGCLEAVASEYAVKKQVAKVLAGNSASKKNSEILIKEVKKPNSPTIAEILSAWDKGDKITKAILDEGLKYLGGSIANVINLINPRLVLIDGQFFSRPELSNQLLATIKEHTFALTDSETEYEFMNYDLNRCSIGGAACAIRHFLVNGNSKENIFRASTM